MKAGNKQDTVMPFVDGMVEFLHRSAADENRTNEVLKACVGLLGDLGQTFGVKMQQLYQMPFVPMLIQQAAQADDEDIQEVAQWAQSVRKKSLFPLWWLNSYNNIICMCVLIVNRWWLPSCVLANK